jgi:hypothetical protein
LNNGHVNSHLRKIGDDLQEENFTLTPVPHRREVPPVPNNQHGIGCAYPIGLPLSGDSATRLPSNPPPLSQKNPQIARWGAVRNCKVSVLPLLMVPALASPPEISRPLESPPLPQPKPLHPSMKHSIYIPIDYSTSTLAMYWRCNSTTIDRGTDVGRVDGASTSGTADGAKRKIETLGTGTKEGNGSGDKQLKRYAIKQDHRDVVDMLLECWTLPFEQLR